MNSALKSSERQPQGSSLESPALDSGQPVDREWLASLRLHYRPQAQRTALVDKTHCGPLRVQRPFFPEKDGCNHTYILHPPGGMAVGDKIAIDVELEAGSQALITTPSAGRMYGFKGMENCAHLCQTQQVNIRVHDEALCEWMPQETIIFDSAQAKLHTQVHLSEKANYIGWDIVRLGRIASGERFRSGYCHQSLELYRDGELVFIEKNPIIANSELVNARWGLQGQHTFATCIATVTLTREVIDELVERLEALNQREAESVSIFSWGLTQKDDVFIARYLGCSILDCRAGLELIWQTIRPFIAHKEAVIPRIWNT